MEQFWKITLDLLEGFGQTLNIFAVTLLCAIPLGLIICFGAISKWKPLAAVIRSLVWIVRGTPLMLQLIVVYYGPGLVFGKMIFNEYLATYITFSLNYACYFSEIFRGGIQSIPVGQYEACQVLGMSKTETFFKVVLLQVVKRIVPPMSNEIITLVKDTSLARVVAVTEIIMCAERFTKQGLIGPLFSTALYFLAFNGILTVLLDRLEKKLNYFR